jgi:DNA-directed RNA polymerase subunit K/omega
MVRSQEQKVEELSKQVGGRFVLTALIQKRMREYHLGGRTFMPDVRNLNELFELVLEEIEQGQITLELPERAEANPLLQ